MPSNDRQLLGFAISGAIKLSEHHQDLLNFMICFKISALYVYEYII